jgi:hypothetical protein
MVALVFCSPYTAELQLLQPHRRVNSSDVSQLVPTNATDAVAIPVSHENAITELRPTAQHDNVLDSGGHTIALPAFTDSHIVAIPAITNRRSIAISAIKLWCSNKHPSECFAATTEHEIAGNRPTASVDESLPSTLKSSKCVKLQTIHKPKRIVRRDAQHWNGVWI